MNYANMKHLIPACFILLFSAFTLFYQDISQSQDYLQEKEAIKMQIMKEIPYNSVYGHFIAYSAIRENDPSLCNNLDTATATLCNGDLDVLLHLRNIATNQCEGLPQEIRPFCLNIDNCNKQKGSTLKNMCNGFEAGDVSLIVKSENEQNANINLNVYDNTNPADVQEELSIYKGFKNGGSQETCEKYASNLIGKRAYLCEVIFSKSPLNNILDSAVEDIAYFILSENYNDKKFCEQIKNTNVKYGCLSELGSKLYFEFGL